MVNRTSLSGNRTYYAFGLLVRQAFTNGYVRAFAGQLVMTMAV